MAFELQRNNLFYHHQLSHDQIDDLLGEKLSPHYPEAKAQHLGKVHEFCNLANFFTQNGIDFIPLKGPILSYRLYQDPLYRSFNDLDFLLNPQFIKKALDVLTEIGYQSPFYSFPDDNCRKDILFRHMNEVFLYHPTKDVGIELHWRLFTDIFAAEETIQRIIAGNQSQITFNGQHFTVFSIEFELLYLIIHGGLHHWNKLKWLVDIKDILAKFTIDESHFLHLSNELQTQRLVAVCNELLKAYFPNSKLLPYTGKAPKQLLRFSKKVIVTKQKEDKKSVWNFILIFWHSLWAFPGIRYKISMLKQVLFATDLAAKKWLPCSEFVYYLVSPFWKLWRGFR